jgi:hypothetical protein
MEISIAHVTDDWCNQLVRENVLFSLFQALS